MKMIEMVENAVEAAKPAQESIANEVAQRVTAAKMIDSRTALITVDGTDFKAIRHTPGGESGYSVWGFRRADLPASSPFSATHSGDIENAIREFVHHSLVR